LPQQKNKKVHFFALFLFFLLAYDKFCQFAAVPLHRQTKKDTEKLFYKPLNFYDYATRI
jgi:hypothetical protein